MEKKRHKKVITLRVDPDVLELWDRVAKKYGWTKVQILEDLLSNALPPLENEDPRGLFATLSRKLGQTMLEMGDLIDGRNVKAKK
jgi:hypothetical protein